MAQDHLRFAGQDAAIQLTELERIVRACPVLMQALDMLQVADLPDGWIVSGAIYNQVWNDLTGRPAMTGVKDIDIFYFDPDVSWEAEDRVIRRIAAQPWDGPPIEVRNQARVHLWYETHFGVPCAPITSSRDGVDHFASRTHSVAMRKQEHGFETYAPYGLDDIFAFRVTPNYIRDNAETHHAKGTRQKAVWPELTIVDWAG